MTSVQPQHAELRLEWASEVRNVQQAVVGDLLDGDLTGLQRAVQRMKDDLPTAANATESLFLRQALVAFVDRCAHDLHVRFHTSVGESICGMRPPLEREANWLSPCQAIGSLLDTWLASYVEWFSQRHSIPLVWRAKDLLQQRSAECWTTGRLAREVGCCGTTLVQQFVGAVGISPAEYLARLRIREGLRHLWATSDTVENASVLAGYRSSNKFYRRVMRYTGMTPAALRALESNAFQGRLDNCLPLKILEKHAPGTLTTIAPASKAMRRTLPAG
jgi:AraC-like DNA-binding protein